MDQEFSAPDDQDPLSQYPEEMVNAFMVEVSEKLERMGLYPRHQAIMTEGSGELGSGTIPLPPDIFRTEDSKPRLVLFGVYNIQQFAFSKAVLDPEQDAVDDVARQIEHSEFKQTRQELEDKFGKKKKDDPDEG